MSSSEQAYKGAGVAARSSTPHGGASTGSKDVRPAGTAGTAGATGAAGQRPAEDATTRPSPMSTARPGAPRRVRLTVAQVDPWSVMKLSFLLSVAIGIAMVVASGVLWTVFEGMGVFGEINGVVAEVLGDPTFDIGDYAGFGKVLSLATVIAVADVVLLTAIATLGAFLYNIAASLVGGLHLTLSDD